jgi:hypothetical protein
VPRLDDRLLDCAVYLYKDLEDSARGSASGGSGFLLEVPNSPVLGPPSLKEASNLRGPNGSLFYVVTNWHVVAQGFRVVRFNTQDGRSDALPFDDWEFHPTSDLAAHHVAPSIAYRYQAVPYSYLLKESWAHAYDVGVGDDVVSIGRFVNAEHRQRNAPVARFGNISMMPSEREPIPVRYDLPSGSVTKPQVSFLIESRTLSGFSGSPVFLVTQPWELRDFTLERSLDLARRPAIWAQDPDHSPGMPLMKLLGITWGYLFGKRAAEFTVGGRSQAFTARIENNTGMMGVVPSWKLIELLNQPRLVRQREQIQEEQKDNPPPGEAC